MPPRRFIQSFLIAFVAICRSSADAQERPPDNATAAQIEDAVEKVRVRKFLDAIELFQKIADTAGDELVPVDRHHHAPAHIVVQGHLARLPAEGLKLYRQRVDAQAARRFDEGKNDRRDGRLERLVADMFAATATEDAIIELARRAFLRGDFDAAEHCWRMLLPPFDGDERIFRYPAPRIDAATVRAKLLMLELFRGDRESVRIQLKEFKAKYPDAAGLLAGRTDKYAETLAYLLDHPDETALAPSANSSGWPTYAGNAQRRGKLGTKLPYYWPDGPAWKAPLPFVRGGRFDNPPPDTSHPRSLAFHPVVANGRAYIADGARVLAVDLVSGKVSGAAWPKGGEETRIPVRRDVRHTLTEHDGILYGRFGPAALRSGENEGKRFILALGARKGDSEERDALWRLEPPAGEGVTHFEGAPIVKDDRLFVGVWRQAVGDGQAGVACYRIDDLKALPELSWLKFVGKAGAEPNGETRYRHALVSMSGPNVIYCTDGGAVVALNANDGKTAWEYRYPRHERSTLPRYRDLCPPLCDGGRIYAAPADAERLLCLDAFTGRLIWECEGVEVVHLLGVAQGRLIATLAGQLRGIRGFNLRTGADSGANGWTIHDDGGELTFGRGLVTEDAVVWPTKNGLNFLNPADGTPLRAPIRGSFGNLCYADGVLLVTTATEVWGYVSDSKKLSESRTQFDRHSRPTFPLASGTDAAPRLERIHAAGGAVYGLCVEQGAPYRLAVIQPAAGGKSQWAVDAAAIVHGVPYSTTFDPEYAADESSVIARVSTGKIAILDAESGKTRHVIPATRKPWPQPPAALGDSRFLIPNDASVFILDAKTGKELSRHLIPGAASLTGELPGFRIHQGDPLLLIRRNHGVEVDKLIGNGLRRAWSREPIYLGDRLDDVAFTGDRFFTAAANVLTGYAWKDGERLWEMPLPEMPRVHWKVTPAPQGILVYPDQAILTQTDFAALAEFRRVNNWDRLMHVIGKSYDVWTARELPVLVIDPADGGLMQRSIFPALGPAADVVVTSQGVMIKTDSGSWPLSAK